MKERLKKKEEKDCQIMQKAGARNRTSKLSNDKTFYKLNEWQPYNIWPHDQVKIYVADKIKIS